jgi:hypothetical protein
MTSLAPRYKMGDMNNDHHICWLETPLIFPLQKHLLFPLQTNNKRPVNCDCSDKNQWGDTWI